MPRLESLVRDAANCMSNTHIGNCVRKEADMEALLRPCLLERNLKPQVPHPVIRSVKNLRKRQGARSAIDYAMENRDHDLQCAIEIKWYRKKDVKSLANEVLRDLIRLELVGIGARCAFGFSSFFILGGDRQLVENLWSSPTVFSKLLPRPFEKMSTKPFLLDICEIRQQFGRFRGKDFFSRTWSYFANARPWRSDYSCDFENCIPIPRSLAITEAHAFGTTGATVVCGWQVSRVGPGPWIAEENPEWVKSRFVAQQTV